MVVLGSTVVFKGYANNVEDKLFEKGQELSVKEVLDEEEGIYLVTDGTHASEVFKDEIESVDEDIDVQFEDFSEPVSSENNELLKEHSSTLLEDAKNISESIHKSYFKYGNVCTSIYNNSLYEDAGYTGLRAFERYCEEELGFPYGKTMQCINIYTNLSSVGLTEDDLEGISYTKASYVGRIIDTNNKDFILDYARNHSVRELIEYVQDLKEKAEDGEYLDTEVKAEEKKQSVSFKFKYYPDQAEFVQSVLSQADVHFDCEGDLNKAMEAILHEYANVVEGVEIPLNTAVEIFNRKYGTNFTVQEANRSREMG